MSVVSDQETVCFEFFKATMSWAYIQGVHVCVCVCVGGGGGVGWIRVEYMLLDFFVGSLTFGILWYLTINIPGYNF